MNIVNGIGVVQTNNVELRNQRGKKQRATNDNPNVVPMDWEPAQATSAAASQTINAAQMEQKQLSSLPRRKPPRYAILIRKLVVAFSEVQEHDPIKAFGNRLKNKIHTAFREIGLNCPIYFEDSSLTTDNEKIQFRVRQKELCKELSNFLEPICTAYQRIIKPDVKILTALTENGRISRLDAQNIMAALATIGQPFWGQALLKDWFKDDPDNRAWLVNLLIDASKEPWGGGGNL